jgi:SAM-dependent methyltransferase
VADALLERRDWLGVQWAEKGDVRDVRLLDYACGTGAITNALGPCVTTIRGIDISENMVEQYNKAALTSGLKPEQASAAVGDLVGETVPAHLNGPEYQDFDLAVIGLGFHHMEDPARAAKRLTERLKPGTGVLLIIDFLPFESEHQLGEEYRKQLPEGHDFPDMSSTIKHTGFQRQGIKKLFEDAGLEDFGWSVLDDPSILELKSGTRQRTLFFAKGRRAPTAWQKLSNWIGGLQDSAAGQMQYGPDGK